MKYAMGKAITNAATEEILSEAGEPEFKPSMIELSGSRMAYESINPIAKKTIPVNFRK